MYKIVHAFTWSLVVLQEILHWRGVENSWKACSKIMGFYEIRKSHGNVFRSKLLYPLEVVSKVEMARILQLYH